MANPDNFAGHILKTLANTNTLPDFQRHSSPGYGPDTVIHGGGITIRPSNSTGYSVDLGPNKHMDRVKY